MMTSRGTVVPFRRPDPAASPEAEAPSRAGRDLAVLRAHLDRLADLGGTLDRWHGGLADCRTALAAIEARADTLQQRLGGVRTDANAVLRWMSDRGRG